MLSSSTNLALTLCLFLACLSMAAGQCEQYDFAYAGDNILVSGHHNLQSSWEACQASCQIITDCTNWTWFMTSDTAQDFCELHFSNQFALPIEGTVSGPRDC